MVQNISANGQNYGSLSKIGTTENGRTIYQVTDGAGKIAGRLSVAPNDVDTFEKSYDKLMKAAPKLQEYAQNSTPEKMQKRKKAAGWTIGIAGLIGGGVPIYLTRNWERAWKQAIPSVGGAIAGLAVGLVIAKKLLTPPGMKEINEASKALQTCDVQPLQ